MSLAGKHHGAAVDRAGTLNDRFVLAQLRENGIQKLYTQKRAHAVMHEHPLSSRFPNPSQY